MEIANGKYRAKARQGVLDEVGEGTPRVAVEFILSDADWQGQGITWHGYLTDKTYERTVLGLRYCGWEGDDLSDLSGIDKNEVELVIENETNDDGATYPRVRWVNKVNRLIVKNPMSPERAKQFAAAMKSKVRAVDAANGQRKKPSGPPSSEPPPVTEDDIPF